MTKLARTARAKRTVVVLGQHHQSPRAGSNGGTGTGRYLQVVSQGSRVRAAPSWPRLSEAERDVLLELLVHGSRPRSELADRLRLSRPTLSRVAKVLVTEGLLIEGATELRSTTGRP